MTEQEKRDRIIERLDRCSGEITCNDCSRVRFCEELDVYRVCQDAIVLLKAQEPRLVTEADFDGADEYGYIPVWTEGKDGDMYWECIPKVAIKDPDGIGVLRYWTSRPTDEQREAIPWIS